MVKLILGKKGSGKTKKMIDLANDSVETKGGSIVYINKDNRVIYDLKHDIRLISMDEYEELNNTDEYIGFLYGIISSDHDIEVMYIDSILRHTHIDVKDLPKFLERIRNISKKYNIEFIVSISADLSEVEQLTTEYEILN